MGTEFIRGDTHLYIGLVPGRRSHGIFLVHGNVSYQALAYCKSEDHSAALILALKDLLGPFIREEPSCATGTSSSPDQTDSSDGT